MGCKYSFKGNPRVVPHLSPDARKWKAMDKQQLFMELQNIEGRGITIFLEGTVSSPEIVTNALCVKEDYSYMRDYVYEEGVLKELHFDKVKNE